jgi:hypothetical protein
VDEDGLPELVISELTAAQIEELRNRDEEGLEAGTAVIHETLQEEIEDEDEEDGIVEEGDD